MRGLVVAALLFGSVAHAVPVSFGHQSRLVDANGTPLNGSTSVTLTLFDSADGPTPTWQRTYAVQADNGFYSVVLEGLDDSDPPVALDSALLNGPGLWIGTEVGGAELGPRQRLFEVPFAAVGRSVPVVTETASSCTGEGSIQWNRTAVTLEVCHDNEWTAVANNTPNIAQEPGYRRWSDGTYATTCEAYRQGDPGHEYTGATGDGVYRIDPTGSAPTDVWCDMTTDDGGWTMCWTEQDGTTIHLATDEPGGTFGVDGYRGDCRDVPFSEVLYVNHNTDQRAWFSKNSSGDIVARDTGYSGGASGFGLFTGHGVASTSWSYQLLVCDEPMETTFFISGYTNCWKSCGSWCSDTTTHYYRSDGTTGGSYNGLSFRENGHTNVSNKRLSVGLR